MDRGGEVKGPECRKVLGISQEASGVFFPENRGDKEGMTDNSGGTRQDRGVEEVFVPKTG